MINSSVRPVNRKGVYENMKKIVFRILNTITVLMFVIMVVVVFLQVICRYILHVSIPWTEELARVLLVWIVYLAIAEVEAHHDGIRTVYFIQKLPRAVYKAILVFSNVAAICLFICLFIGAIKQIQTNSVYYLSSMPFLSRTIFYYPVLIGAPLSIWMQVEEILDFIREPFPLHEDAPGGEKS